MAQRRAHEWFAQTGFALTYGQGLRKGRRGRGNFVRARSLLNPVTVASLVGRRTRRGALSRQLFVKFPGNGGIATAFGKPQDFEHPHAAIKRDGQDITGLHRTTCGIDP